MPNQEATPQRPSKSEMLTQLIARFFGSWWAVVLHTLWFAFWIIFRFDTNILTLWVSLEAIFIGIFLLMAANKAELKRHRKEERERHQQKQMLGMDISVDKKQVEILSEINQRLETIERRIGKQS